MFRKYFLFILLLVGLTTPSFSQAEVARKSLVTSTAWTNQMVWSSLESKWLFVDNHDKEHKAFMWDIILYDNNTGIMMCGTVKYTITNYNFVKMDDGYDLAEIIAFNHVLGREVTLLLGRPEGKTFLAIYDYESRGVFYFAE